MLFNSIEYFVFLPVVYLLYRLLGHRSQNRMLLVASYIFYGAWDIRFLFLIVLSAVVDYCASLMIADGKVKRSARWGVTAYLGIAAFLCVGVDWRIAESALVSGSSPDWGVMLSPLRMRWFLILVGIVGVAHAVYPQFVRWNDARRRRFFLVASILTNLAILGFFKYFDFFIASAERASAAVGFDWAAFRLDIVLPVGISFYTFQTMSYTIDVYGGKIAPTRRFLDFALYVAYFPQLVAGPIERGARLLPKITSPRILTLDETTRGAALILLGLFKKVAIADSVAASVDSIFLTTGAVGPVDVCLATLLFAVQIYGDFAGYSDIARGTSKLLGIELTINFRQPYFSSGPAEFWRRWHISLSSWLRDYLYIPLGGNRVREWAVFRNLMITMVLGGLWHGAASNFVLWGIYQGIVLCVYRYLFHDKAPPAAAPHIHFRAGKVLEVGVFFVVTCYGWLLFRAVSFDQIVTFTHTLFTGWGDLSCTMKRPTLAALAGLPLFIAYESTQFFTGEDRFARRLPPIIRGALHAAMIFLILMGLSNEPVQFIYFQF